MISSIPIIVCSLREEGYHVFIIMLVEGKTKRMLLDTGASRTVLDLNRFIEEHPEVYVEENEDKATGLGTNSGGCQLALHRSRGIAPRDATFPDATPDARVSDFQLQQE